MMTISEIKQELKKYDRKQLYKEKVIKMQASMREMGIDGIICFKPQNTFYLSGFNPILYSHPVVVLIPAEGDAVLLVHSLRARHSADEAAIDDIRLFGAWQTRSRSRMMHMAQLILLRMISKLKIRLSAMREISFL